MASGISVFFFRFPQNLFMAENFLFHSFFSPKTLPLALGNFTYPTSSNDFFWREEFWDFSSVYLNICANFLGKNQQIFWYHKIEKKEPTYN